MAPAVERLAAAGDEQAAAILERHAGALLASVAGVARSLCLGAPPVAVQGGALTHLRTFRQLFEEGLAQRLPRASLVTAAGESASGALALAQARISCAATADRIASHGQATTDAIAVMASLRCVVRESVCLVTPAVCGTAKFNFFTCSDLPYPHHLSACPAWLRHRHLSGERHSRWGPPRMDPAG